MNRTVVTPETEAARNYLPSWLALTALSTVGNRADHRIGSSRLGGSGGRCSFQQPGNHGGDHLNVTHSSVAMSMIRSLHLPGIRQFQPWNRYRMAKVISPQAPPSGSCSLCTRTPDRAYRAWTRTAGGWSGRTWVAPLHVKPAGPYWCGLSATPPLDASRAPFPSPWPLCICP